MGAHKEIFKLDNNILISSDDKNDNNAVKIEEILSLYKTYEFSDRMTLVQEKSTSYPSLYNYVNAGIFTREELDRIIYESRE